jgi:hypothetical protein
MRDNPGGSSTPPRCALYPIALHTQTLAGVSAGTAINDILNGGQSGNFGWLSWNGSTSESSLVAGLTPPGDSASYLNPANLADHVLSIGDSVRGRTGLSNSKALRAALDQLKTKDITVPVYSIYGL